MIEYKSYDYTRTIPVDDYILRYRDERRFMAYCRECRRYGNSWSCPPFNDSEDYLSGFRNLLIVCTRITPVVLDVPDAVEAGQELMHRERSRLDKRLLALEEEYNGRAFYAGSCILCPWEECARRSGKACRYPSRIRRSLEACGFDLGRTTSELFGIEMKWSENRNLPEYLLLVSGSLSDRETPIW